MDRRSELLLRVYIVFAGISIFALLILGQVIKITLLEGDKWREMGGRNVKWESVEGERGNIYDINGNLLATSLPYFDIYLDLLASSDQLFDNNIGQLSQYLEKHFGKTAQEWQMELKKERLAGKSGKPGRRHYPLFKSLTKDRKDLLLTFPIFREGRYKGGLICEEKTKRGKPYKELCSRTIGLDRKNASKIGLERTYDSFLKGEQEKRLLRRFPGGQWLPVYDPGKSKEKRGGDVVTTLDMHMQDIVHNELLNALTKWDAEAGTAVVMEVETGAIKAMANLGQTQSGQYIEKFNYAVGRLSEPGSTFKLISSLAMMKDSGLELDTKVDLSKGKKKFYDRVMFDSERHNLNVSTFAKAFEISSNVGMANLAFSRYGKSRTNWTKFYEAINSLGVMSPTGIEIAGEQSPFFKNPADLKSNDTKRWSGTTVPWMAHGYELEMTPLQILNVYNAVANGGRLMKPYLTAELIDSEGNVKRNHPRSLKEKIADKDVIEKARKLLEGVAERGTAKNLKVYNTSFAGKTGTTRLNYWLSNVKKEYNASFAGYFPVESPKYSMVVVIYNPKGAYYGSSVAGPVFRNIVQRSSGLEQRDLPTLAEGSKVLKAHAGYNSDYSKLMKFIGLEYDGEKSKWVNLESTDAKVIGDKKKLDVEKVPDVRGMGLRDALYILESIGLQVEVFGVGQVYKQSIPPGRKLDKKSITIHLK